MGVYKKKEIYIDKSLGFDLKYETEDETQTIFRRIGLGGGLVIYPKADLYKVTLKPLSEKQMVDEFLKVVLRSSTSLTIIKKLLMEANLKLVPITEAI